MSDDDETTDSSEAVTPASESAETSTASDGERHTVHIPQWLAGALVVVLALVIGAVGYALGASSNDNDGPSFRPINASQQGGQGGGFPGGQQGGPGGQQGGPGGGPSFDDRGDRGDRQGQDNQDQDDDSNDDDQDEDANY
jgi:hypothetical protein